MTTTDAPAVDGGDNGGTHHSRPPFYRDAVVVKWLAQVIALVAALAALGFFAAVAGDNLEASGINTSYEFLSEDPGIFLAAGIDTDPNTGGRALWVGMVNTIRMAAAGIVVATLLGVLIGLARLSPNWLLRKLGSVYIETIRNIPLLVQILLIFAILGALPSVTPDQGPINGWLHVSNKGLSLPRVFAADGFYQWLVFLAVGAVAGRWLAKRRQHHRDETGEVTHPGWWFTAVLLAFGVVGWFAHPVVAPLGQLFEWIESAIDWLPAALIQIVLVALAVGAAAWWIARFLRSHRTPSGRTRMSDDDWFRVIFAGTGAALVSLVVLVVWPGLASWLGNSGADAFGVLADKFDSARTGQPVDALRPQIEQLGRFPNYGPEGLNFGLGFAAVYFGVVLYTAAFIAEIVRGGILSVHKGQTEAAAALGLRRSTALRRVILPQALRAILPPLGNQYLNLTKNTSLAIAVGYSDIVQVGQTIYNQTGQTLPVISIWMLFYLACSLTISVVVNFANVRLRIVER